MSHDFTRLVTVDGYPYRVLAEDLPGAYPVVIFSNNDVRRLNSRLVCEDDNGYSLVEQSRRQARYFNVYAAADGAFCMGSKAFVSNQARLATRDSERALFGIQVVADNGQFVSASVA